jgi:hypothetical protein
MPCTLSTETTGTANYGKPSSELVEMAIGDAGYHHIDCAQVRVVAYRRAMLFGILDRVDAKIYH